MSLVSEAIARYHKLIESEPYIDLAWAHAAQRAAGMPAASKASIWATSCAARPRAEGLPAGHHQLRAFGGRS